MKDVVKELNARKAIQNIDLGALRMLATSYEMYLRATQQLLEEGPVIMIKYERQLTRLRILRQRIMRKS